MDIIRELKKVVAERLQQGHDDTRKSLQPGVYGPALPPDMLPSVVRAPKSPSIPSPDESPVQQRSPSGASIPLREEALDKGATNKSLHRDESSTSNRKLDCTPLADSPDFLRTNRSKLDSKRLEAPVINQNSDEQMRLLPRAKSPSPIQSRDCKNENDSAKEPVRSTRRAETPLAYKRHRRSSRSLSRERRLIRRQTTSDSSRRWSRYDRKRSATRSVSRSRSNSNSVSPSASSFSSSPRSRHLSRSRSYSYSTSWSNRSSDRPRRRARRAPQTLPRSGGRKRRRRRGGRRRGRRRKR